ncbi:hypothetical protein BCR33DRAFT_720394, partial [Rhizoclosmatium globosum]
MDVAEAIAADAIPSASDVLVIDASESIQAALRAWTTINLAVLQKQLDVQGLEIVENQKESNRSKKELSDKTKEFRKMSDEEKLKEFKSLLKAYQQEIDSIAKRSKTAEAAFLSLYKHLAEAPDPAPLIASLSNHPQLEQELNVANEELKVLKATIAGMERDVASGKASEGVVGSLKSRLANYEAKLDEMVSEKVLAKEIEIKQATDEKIRIYKETEYSLQRQLNLLKDQLSTLQSSHDVTQAKLVDYSSQYDQEVAGKLGELEIVIGDLDRANQRAANVAREMSPATLQRKIKVQDAEISKLLDELNKSKTKLNEREAYSTRRINELEREMAVKKLETEELREKLLQFDDYERIKRELDLMKTIEFGAQSLAESGDGLWDEPSSNSSASEANLEKLLIDKNKRLLGEVSTLKVPHSHTQDLEHYKLQSETQAKLIAKLEEDVYQLNSVVAGKGGKSSVPAPVEDAEMDPLMQINVRSNLSSQPELVPVLGHSVLPVAVPAPIIQEAPVPAPNSSIDRYRQRNTELEEQAKQTAATIADLKYQMDSLKSDNIKLYEKLRYAESFQSTGNNSTTISISPPSRTINNRSPDDVNSRYNSLYETTLDPFSRFSRSEQASRVQKLNPAEKAALVFTKILVGNKYTRIGFVVYSAVLHLLWEECRHDHAVPAPVSNVN